MTEREYTYDEFLDEFAPDVPIEVTDEEWVQQITKDCVEILRTGRSSRIRPLKIVERVR